MLQNLEALRNVLVLDEDLLAVDLVLLGAVVGKGVEKMEKIDMVRSCKFQP